MIYNRRYNSRYLERSNNMNNMDKAAHLLCHKHDAGARLMRTIQGSTSRHSLTNQDTDRQNNIVY